MAAQSIAIFSDGELISKLKNNDENALEALFRKYYSSLVRFANGILKNETDAEDIVQNVFVKIWEGRNQMVIHTAVKSYLYMAVKNSCFNQLKQYERNFWVDDSWEDDVRLSSNTIVADLAAKSLEKKIAFYIDQLPPKCRLIFKMSRFDEKTYKEIAEILNISVKTVENQMGKALQILRGHLKEHLANLAVLFYFFLKIF